MNISVILCTYNRCESLAKTLESIATQRLPETVEWEVLVVDNNSTDRTRDTVEEFSRKHPGRFRHVMETNQGLSFARNTGIRQSRGSVLAFTDDDVIVEPSWLWNLTCTLLSENSMGAGGKIIPVWSKPLPSWLSTDDPHIMGPFVAFDVGSEPGPLFRPPYGANMAFRLEAFETYGGFRTDLGPRPGSEIRRDDIEFANRLLTAGESLRYEPNAIVYHPAPERRMTKNFVLRWWFWFGYGEVVDMGLPGARWRIKGVPLYLFRRLIRWSLQWMISIKAPRRFSCQRNAWYIAGIATACFQRQNRAGFWANETAVTHSEPKPPQVTSHT